jgi:Rrf2 family transcriptional regulator, iron-sulfur cluster assembly transcription factor
MLLSRSCEYAIRTLLHVAAAPADGPIAVREIAGALELPTATLAKIVQGLTRHGLLVSHKGPGGGVALGRSADTVTVLDVVDVVDGPSLRTQCVLGVPGCRDATLHCPLHDRWRVAREQILEALGARTLKDLAEDLAGRDYALAGSARHAVKARVSRRGR